MAKYDIKDFEKACDMIAFLLDINSEKYLKEVNKEAERRYRSRHFTEMNKAVATKINQNKSSWFNAGYAKGKKDWCVWYFCAICGERIDIPPNSDSHKGVVVYMREKGWAHGECHKKRVR
jgi:hypothetical protein